MQRFGLFLCTAIIAFILVPLAQARTCSAGEYYHSGYYISASTLSVEAYINARKEGTIYGGHGDGWVGLTHRDSFGTPDAWMQAGLEDLPNSSPWAYVEYKQLGQPHQKTYYFGIAPPGGATFTVTQTGTTARAYINGELKATVDIGATAGTRDAFGESYQGSSTTCNDFDFGFSSLSFNVDNASRYELCPYFVQRLSTTGFRSFLDPTTPCPSGVSFFSTPGGPPLLP